MTGRGVRRRSVITITSTAAFEDALNAMMAAAQAEGESFVDVTSKGLFKSVNGPTSSSKGFGTCCRLMRRMMIPGDHELSATYGHNVSSLLIRFRLPR